MSLMNSIAAATLGGRRRVEHRNSTTPQAVPVWDFGWIPPHLRTEDQANASAAAVQAMPRFEIRGQQKTAGDRAFLFDVWKHPDVVAAIGAEFPGFHQLTGSCVGAGGGNVEMTVALVEIIRKGEPELIFLPWWPYTYGRSRYHLGERGRGEGSTESAWAKAATEDGVLSADSVGHKFNNSDGLTLTEAVEMTWSDGGRILPELITLRRRNLIRTAALLKTPEQWREALFNGYPIGCASDWGGHMECSVIEGVLLNRRADTWNHKQSCLGCLDHPKLGWLYWIHNQWGRKTHGDDPAGGPGGGYWVQEKDFVAHTIANGESYAYSQFDGFPALDWGSIF